MLLQVSFEWRLDSSIVFEATKYLDWYLTNSNVEKLGRQAQCIRFDLLDHLYNTPLDTYRY